MHLPAPSKRRKAALTLGWFSLLVLTAILVLYLSSRRKSSQPSEPEASHFSSLDKAPAPPTAPQPAAQTPPPANGDDLLIVSLERIQQLDIEKNTASEDRLAVLNGLFRWLDRLPLRERRERLRHFFASGADVETLLRFRIGAGGWLESWPSLRTALLDYTGRTDSELAAELGESIFQGFKSSDEWAIALRDQARRADTEAARATLGKHLESYLSHTAWTAKPGVGFLEGFDVIVATKRADLIPQLASLLSDANPKPTQFAAFLALDRLMLASPSETLEQFANHPDLLAGRPEVRAGLFARADPRDSRQTEALTHYFERQDISEAEKVQFAGLFPNLNQTFSPNLLSTQPHHGLAEMLAIDAAAIGQLKAWRTEGRFAGWEAAFVAAEVRLKEGLSQAEEAKTGTK